MIPTVTIFTFVLEDTISDKDIEVYDKKMDSFMRNFSYQGFRVKNYQDKVYWG